MSRPAVLALLSPVALRDEADRIGAAADVSVVHGAVDSIPARKTWAGANALLLDGDSARRCAAADLPRRSAVYVLTTVDAAETAVHRGDAALLEAAVAIGAEQVFRLPGQAAGCVSVLAALTDSARPDRRGSVIAVLGGRGGAGASVFATALGLAAEPPGLLVDLDPWGGGVDLLIGGETTPGLRWPDIGVRDGRLEWAAIRAALPRFGDLSVLSGTRTGGVPHPAAVDAVIDAGRRGGATVVCDLPRPSADVTQPVIETADLVALVVPCDVRSCAAAGATARAVTALNPNVGVVVRGPSPGGLLPKEVVGVIGLPLLASMRPEPLLAEKLERSGLRLRARSPLALAARSVLDILAGNPIAGVPSAA
jgi:secretion/DNA translocation related CpaE-like protein